MSLRLTVISVLLSLILVSLAIAQEADRKQREAQAKQLVAEGRVLEKQEKLAEARDKYVDAEGILPTGDALGGIRRIDDAEKQKVEALLGQARNLYDQGKYADSAQLLQQALDLQPADAALEYDLVLCDRKLGERANAALHIDEAIAMLPDAKERAKLLQERSDIVMGAADPPTAGDAKKNLAAFNASFLQEDLDPGDPKAEGGSICSQAVTLSSQLPADPAVAFNAAKCAEEDARPSDAAERLADYARLAPNALDLAEAQLEQKSLTALAALPGDQGQLVRQHYATAARYLDYRRYDRATSEYEAAEQARPDYADTQWHLALLYEAFGNVAKARDHFTLFEKLGPDQDEKSEAEAHLSNLEGRRELYDDSVGDAQDVLSELLLSSLGVSSEGTKHKTKLTRQQSRYASQRYKNETRATEKFPAPYVQRELLRARADLDAAAEVFPLGAAANEMLALIDLQGNDWPGAFRNFDAVASQNLPVSFYAQANSGHDKTVRAVKIEIGANTVRIVYLSAYDSKKQVSVAPARPAGDDGLGNLVISNAQEVDANAESLIIQPAELKGIQTDKNFVVLKLAKDEIYLAPLDMLSDVPFEGSASRTFGNEYTRLFVRYLGYEDAKLGKEGMTTGEKVKLGFQIAQIGASVGLTVATMGAGAPAAYGAALRTAELANALTVLHGIGEGTKVIQLASAGARVAEDLQTSAATLERTTNDQRAVISGLAFKVIPEEAPTPKFRDKL